MQYFIKNTNIQTLSNWKELDSPLSLTTTVPHMGAATFYVFDHAIRNDGNESTSIFNCFAIDRHYGPHAPRINSIS